MMPTLKPAYKDNRIFDLKHQDLTVASVPSANPFFGLNQNEALNINILYLQTIHSLLSQYILCSYRGDMELALNSLQLLATTMSPKIDTKAEEIEIDRIENELPRAITRDSDGTIVRYNPSMMLTHRRWMRRVYKALLMKLDSRGMLTFAPKDYKSVMGDFSKA